MATEGHALARPTPDACWSPTSPGTRPACPRPRPSSITPRTCSPTCSRRSWLRPTFRIAELEGDAVFAYALDEEADGSMLLDTVERSYFAFRSRSRDVTQATACTCGAGREKLTGTAVVTCVRCSG